MVSLACRLPFLISIVQNSLKYLELQKVRERDFLVEYGVKNSILLNQ